MGCIIGIEKNKLDLFFKFSDEIVEGIVLKNKKESFRIKLVNSLLEFLDLKEGVYQIYGEDGKVIKYGLPRKWSRYILDKHNGIKVFSNSKGDLMVKKEKYTKDNRNLVFKTNITYLIEDEKSINIAGVSNIIANDSIKIENREFYLVLHKHPTSYKKIVPIGKISNKGVWECTILASEFDSVKLGRFQIGLFEKIEGILYGSWAYVNDFKENCSFVNHTKEISFIKNNRSRLICSVDYNKVNIDFFELLKIREKNIVLKFRLEINECSELILKNNFSSLNLKYKVINEEYIEVFLPLEYMRGCFNEFVKNARFSLWIHDANGFEKELKFITNDKKKVHKINFEDSLVYISAEACRNQIRYRKIKILRNIKKIKFIDNKIVLKGNIIGNGIDIRQQKVFLVVINRDTGKKVYFTINKFEKDLFFTIPYPSHCNEHLYNSFEKTLDIDYLLKNLNKGMWDFYIQIGPKKFFESSKKLGYAFYDYKKDSVLDYFQYKGIDFKASITPKGNLKIKSEIVFLDTKKNKGNKQVWIIGERPDTAQENGLLFFRYVFKSKPNVKAYYIIDKNSPDLANFTEEEKENIVYIGTDKQYKVCNEADAFIGTHDIEYFVPFGVEMNKRNVKKIFLQHGVMGRKRAEYHKFYYKKPFDMVVVSSDEEKKLFETEFKYHPKEIVVAGLARFDHLYDSKIEDFSIGNDYLLVMPTWREWINFASPFLKSEYYFRYEKLLTNKKLQQILYKKNMKLLFYPHYRMQPYINHFKKFENNVVEIVEIGKVNVQDLLIGSKMMITDYSSVSFDMNFMEKPVVFYHFDEERFFESGILRPINETFIGDICSKEEDLINAVSKYVDRNFIETTETKKNITKVIKFKDNKNRERTFESILEAKHYNNKSWLFESWRRKWSVHIKFYIKYTPLYYLYIKLLNINSKYRK